MANEGEATGRVPSLPYVARARKHLAAAREKLANGGLRPTLAA